eukprot:CAMPEP_0205800462 /NCGR_PEP_ID=MMETSP0205-20121125/2123_1 /ASSEMBLY_ACC=CAM_ASM_000278 /TAXON_ID=36767 /ORGANISM="Euplotes focardii, Strain TN1" /LENGTH=65 /DNA_ID=CAMNT_0053063579 /DNA_START=304 /DNA_END=498 /DNA_ORIENTATION=-
MLVTLQNWDECLKVMDYILDTRDNDEMEVEIKDDFDNIIENKETTGGLSLKEYISKKSIGEINQT